jgi:sigma-B regulation protein RsbU (phosphoserine phosphatase)
MSGMDFAVRTESIGKGEVVVIYSDGVVDARDAAGTGFGWDRLLDLVRPQGTAAEVVERIRGEVERHASDAENFDDVTLLAIRRTAKVAAGV